MRDRRLMLLLSALVVFSVGPAEASGETGGRWEGTAAAAGDTMHFAFDLSHDGDGWEIAVDVVDLGVTGLPGSAVRVEGDSLFFEIHGDAQVDSVAGRLHRDVFTGTLRTFLAPVPARLELREVAEPDSGKYRAEDIAFANGDVELAGTLRVPAGEGPHPAIVFVHGSGPQLRFADSFLADRFARAGIASLSYDKRGTGQSGGDWKRADFEVLASDVVAAVEALRAREEIDGSRLGLRGQSQGGWVAPLAATRGASVAAVMIVSGPLVSPAVEGHWDVISRLRRAGWNEETVARAVAVSEAQDEAVRTGDWSLYDDALDAVRAEPWFADAGFDEELDTDSWRWRWYRSILDFDPGPVWEALDVPVLAIFAEHDESVDTHESLAIATRYRDERGKPLTLRMFPGADHGMRAVTRPGETFRWPRFVDGYLDLQIDWLRERFGL